MDSRNISKNDQSKAFDNLKSDFFLRKLFDLIKINKSLAIIKHNKKLQKRLNINSNNYREYCKIEIELKITSNKNAQFIRYIPEKEKKYYHIYFDKSKEEIKRNKLKYNEKAKMIKIIIDYQVKSFEGLFSDCKCIDSIIFKKFNRNDITNMSNMFYGCTSLKKLNLLNLNSKNVTNMSGMFNRCSSLKELNLSNFNTINVINMNVLIM